MFASTSFRIKTVGGPRDDTKLLILKLLIQTTVNEASQTLCHKLKNMNELPRIRDTRLGENSFYQHAETYVFCRTLPYCIELFRIPPYLTMLYLTVPY